MHEESKLWLHETVDQNLAQKIEQLLDSTYSIVTRG